MRIIRLIYELNGLFMRINFSLKNHPIFSWKYIFNHFV